MNNPACANYKIIENNGKKGLGYKDKIVVPVEYDSILTTESSYHYILEKHGKKGLTYYSTIVIPVEYDNILTTSKRDYFIIEKNGKKGLAHYSPFSDGTIAIPIEYDNIFIFPSDYILVKDDIIKTSYGKTYKIKNFNPSSVAIIRDEWIFSEFTIGYHIEYDGKRTDKIYSILKVLLLPIDIPVAIIKKPIDKFLYDWNKQWM